MKELVVELMNAPTCCEELKEVCEKYIKVVDSDEEKAALSELIKAINENINTIDETIEFCKSDKALNMLGEEKCKFLLDKALLAKENGAKYCDCPACSVAEKILNAYEK